MRFLIPKLTGKGYFAPRNAKVSFFIKHYLKKPMARISFTDYCREYKYVTARGARGGEYPCFYCGVKSQSIDHFIPQAFERSLKSFIDIGGFSNEELDNFRKKQQFIPACKECN